MERASGGGGERLGEEKDNSAVSEFSYFGHRRPSRDESVPCFVTHITPARARSRDEVECKGRRGRMYRDTAPFFIFMADRASLGYTAKNAPPAVQTKGLFLPNRGK